MSTAPNRQFWLIVYFYLLSFIIFPFLSQNFILPQNWISYIPAASTPFTSSVDNNYFSLLNRKCFRCGRVSSVRVNSYLAGSRTSVKKTTALSLEMGAKCVHQSNGDWRDGFTKNLRQVCTKGPGDCVGCIAAQPDPTVGRPRCYYTSWLIKV